MRPGHPDLQREAAALAAIDRLVVFVDQYAAAQDSLQGFREALPNARLVVEIRTGTYEVRFHELIKLLPKPFDRVSLNALTRPEALAFGRLCERAGLRLPTQDGRADFRDLLLGLFENRSIRDRLQTALAPLFANRATRRVLTMTMLIAMNQGTIGAAFVRSVIGEDPFAALRPLADLSHEIFETSADSFKARSAVFSSFVLSAFIESDEIADAVVDMTLAAARRLTERPYRILMSDLMAFSRLRQTLHGKGDADAIIIGIYERLRFDERVNGEPLFWLQYAIAMAETDRLDRADEYIAAAYRNAALRPGFLTFQIDTQAFRIALLRATRQRPGQAVFNIEAILTGIEQVDAMLSNDSHRSFAVRVLDHVNAFVAARRTDLTAGESTALQFWLLSVARSLDMLQDEFKVTSGPESVRKRIEASAALFVD